MTEKDDARKQLNHAGNINSISAQSNAVAVAHVHALLEIADAVREATAAFSALNELMAEHNEE